MEKTSKQQIVSLLSLLQACYQNGFSVFPETVEAWHLVFKNEDPEHLKKAFLQAVNDCQFPPSTADMRKILREQVKKDLLPEALKWSPEEALINQNAKKIIIKKAKRYADKATAHYNLNRCYDSEAEQDKAEAFYLREWNAAFKSQFEKDKKKILSLWEEGMEIKEAGELVLLDDSQFLPKEILNDLPEIKQLTHSE